MSNMSPQAELGLSQAPEPASPASGQSPTGLPDTRSNGVANIQAAEAAYLSTQGRSSLAEYAANRNKQSEDLNKQAKKLKEQGKLEEAAALEDEAVALKVEPPDFETDFYNPKNAPQLSASREYMPRTALRELVDEPGRVVKVYEDERNASYGGFAEKNVTRRRAVEIAGAAVLASILGGFGWLRAGRPGLPRQERAVAASLSTVKEVRNGDSFELGVGGEKVTGEQVGWRTKYQAGQLFDKLREKGISTATVRAKYSDALVENAASFTIDADANTVEEAINASVNTFVDTTGENPEVFLRLLPVGTVQVEVRLSNGSEPQVFLIPLESQEYNPQGQDGKQRVFIEVSPNDNVEVPTEEVEEMDRDAESLSVLGVDTKYVVPDFPYEGKVHFLTSEGLAQAAITEKSKFVGEGVPYEGYGRMHAYHKGVRNAIEKLRSSEIHDSDTIREIDSQLATARQNITFYEDSLPPIRSRKGKEAREERPNILDIKYYFPQFDGVLKYLAEGEVTPTATNLADINESLISLVDIYKFVKPETFAIAYETLEPRQKRYVALVVEHTLNALEKAAMKRGGLSVMLDSPSAFRSIISSDLPEDYRRG